MTADKPDEVWRCPLFRKVDIASMSSRFPFCANGDIGGPQIGLLILPYLSNAEHSKTRMEKSKDFDITAQGKIPPVRLSAIPIVQPSGTLTQFSRWPAVFQARTGRQPFRCTDRRLSVRPETDAGILCSRPRCCSAFPALHWPFRSISSASPR